MIKKNYPLKYTFHKGAKLSYFKHFNSNTGKGSVIKGQRTKIFVNYTEVLCLYLYLSQGIINNI